MKLKTLLLILSVLLACCSTEEEKGGKAQKKETTQSQTEKVWYEGGTLHNCTNAEWKNANKENKLATCADWIFTLATKVDGVSVEDFKRLMPNEKFKMFAEKMVEEVEKSVLSGVSADDMRGEAAAYASAYWIMLKAQVRD